MFAAVAQAAPANDSFANRITLAGNSASTTGTNVAATKETGEPAHAGYSGGKSVWWTWTAPFNGPVTVTTTGSDFDTLLGVYTGSTVSSLAFVASDDDSGDGPTSLLTFNAVNGTAYRFAVDGYNASSGAITFILQKAPSNDNFADRINVVGTSTSVTGSNLGATGEIGEPGAGTSNSVWWTWTAPISGYVTIDTVGSNFDTNLGVYTGTTVGGLSLIASDDNSGGGSTSKVSFNALAGATFQIRVNGFNAYGNITLSISEQPLPANDGFATSTAVSGSTFTVTGSNVGALKETGEPNHAGYAGGKSVWWSWTAPASGPVTLDTGDSSFASVVAVYTGSTINALTPVAENPDYGPRYTSLITFAAVQGTTYRIAVDNASGGSGTVSLAFRMPGNNDFSRAFPLVGVVDVSSGANFGATKETGEPSHAGNTGGKSVWWHWTAEYSGPVTVSTAGSNFNTLLALYTGSSVNALTLLASQNDSIPGSDLTSRVNFNATAGTTYRIAVDGHNGANGTIALGLAQSPANNNFTNRTPLSGSYVNTQGFNHSATKETGEPNHAGNSGGKSVWWSWTAPHSGSVTIGTYNTYYEDSASGSASTGLDTLLGVYTGTGVNSLTVVSANRDVTLNGKSKVTFNAVGGTTYQIAVDGFGGAAGAIYLSIILTPPNDNFSSATTLAGASPAATGSNAGATKQTGEPNHSSFGGGRSVWWNWTAPTSGTVAIDTAGSNFKTAVAVYTGGAVNALSLVAKHDGNGTGTAGRVELGVSAGVTYRIAVDGYGHNAGSIVLAFTSIPTIDEQPPEFVGVTVGQTAPFPMSVSGSGFTYRWQVDSSSGDGTGPWVNLDNNATYSGVFTSQLLVNTYGLSLNGNYYRCLLLYPGGSIASDPPSKLTVFARLDGFSDPGGVQPTNQTVTIGSAAFFTAMVDALPEASYTWFRKPAGSNTWTELGEADTDYSGVYSTTLKVNNPAITMSGDQFYCHALQNDQTQDGIFEQESNVVTLTVTKIPTNFNLSATTFPYTGLLQGPTVVPTAPGATFTSSGTLSASSIGTYTVSATANGNYSGSRSGMSWSIVPVSQSAPTISSPSSFTYGGTYTATANSGFGEREWALGNGSTAGGAAINSSTGAITVSSVGIVKIKVRFAGDATHAASPFSPDFTITVNKANQTAVSIASSPNGTYNTLYLATATGGNGTGAIVWALGTGSTAPGASINASTGAVTSSGAGKVVITAYRGADANYHASATTANFTITFAKTTATVMLGGLSAIFDGTAKAATAATNPAGKTVTFTYNGSPSAPINPGSYTVIGTINDANYLGSASGTLVITDKGPVIGTHPFSQTKFTDQTVTFSVSALSGTGSLMYQWRKDGNNLANAGRISGTNSATLKITGAQVTDAGNYNVVVTNGAGSTVSNTAFLTVMVPKEPPADFNGDGVSDVVWYNEQTGVVADGANGNYNPRGGEGGGWIFAGIANVDGDARAEVIWRHVPSGLVAAWCSNGGVLTLGGEGGGWTYLAVGDCDGDNRAEAIWRHAPSGLVKAWCSGGGVLTLGGEGGGWTYIAVADCDGDNRAEVIWHHAPSGLVMAWCSGGGVLTLGGEGGGWTYFAMADCDGDNKAEVIWHHSPSGLLTAWCSGGGVLTLGGEGGGWRAVGTGDFDGDRKAELLWHNTLSGQVATWATSASYINFGIPDDNWIIHE